MRYLLITYVKKPNGQIDEQVELSTRVKDRDQQMCNTILDFKRKQVVKCIIEGKVLATEWSQIRDYYNQVYPDVIQQLEELNPTE